MTSADLASAVDRSTRERDRYLRQLERLRLPRFCPTTRRPPLVLALEGPNGAGKSTLCRRLKRDLDISTCLGTPNAWFSRPFKARMIRDADWFASAMFFLSGCIEQMRVVRSSRERSVVMDRCLWSTLAVHAAETPRRLEAVLAMLGPFASEIRLPDLTIVLEAAFATCASRISRKTEAAQALDRLTANARFHAREQAFYRWLGQQDVNVRFLNVDQLSPREAANEVKTIIHEEFPNAG